MSRITRNAKRDTSEAPIVAALKAYGFSVLKLSVPYGPDLVIAKDGRVRVAEVKTGTKKLRQEQESWWMRWAGNPRLVLCDDLDVDVVVAKWSQDDLGLQVSLHRQARARLKAGKATA